MNQLNSVVNHKDYKNCNTSDESSNYIQHKLEIIRCTLHKLKCNEICRVDTTFGTIADTSMHAAHCQKKQNHK